MVVNSKTPIVTVPRKKGHAVKCNFAILKMSTTKSANAVNSRRYSKIPIKLLPTTLNICLTPFEKGKNELPKPIITISAKMHIITSIGQNGSFLKKHTIP